MLFIIDRKLATDIRIQLICSSDKQAYIRVHVTCLEERKKYICKCCIIILFCSNILFALRQHAYAIYYDFFGCKNDNFQLNYFYIFVVILIKNKFLLKHNLHVM